MRSEELQPEVAMLNACFKTVESTGPMALSSSPVSYGAKVGDTGKVSTEGEKGFSHKRELVGPGTKVSSIASKRQHAGGGKVTELTQDATVVTAHTDAISEFHRVFCIVYSRSTSSRRSRRGSMRLL